jgi:hypothetical protein
MLCVRSLSLLQHAYYTTSATMGGGGGGHGGGGERCMIDGGAGVAV